MPLKRFDGSSFVDITSRQRWDGAAWVALGFVKYWDGATWVTIPLGSGLSASVAPGTAFGYESSFNGPPALTLTTYPVTVTATGGTGAGPTYLWERIGGSSALTAVNPTSATTTFRGTVYGNSERSAVFRCTITRGAETTQVTVLATIQYDRQRGGEVPL